MKLILLGAPGAGKGTQAELISQSMKIPTISTGAILREAVREGTPDGRQAQAYMDAGNLVPDEVILNILESRLKQEDCHNGYILDGVPRTLVQATALEKRGIVFDHVILLDISDQSIIQRMSGRRVCSQCGKTFHITANPPKVQGICDACGGTLAERSDDRPEIVSQRLATYRRETEPLKFFYQNCGNLRRVSVEDRSVDEIFSDIMAVINADENS